MANKTFNTRVKNKRDTAANWEAVATTFQPLDGELIIVDTAAGKTRFKVGRYDTAKGRLLYYNEIPFTDEYLYNDLNESQGKIYDKLKGIDDKSIIEMTLESVFDNTKYVNYRIGLWQFGKTGFYKLNIPKRGTTATQLFLYAQKTKEDGTTPEDPFSQDNLLRISPLTGDKQVESVFVQVDYTDTDTLTVYKVQFLNAITFPGTININTYNKTTQKWDFTSVTESSAKWANNATQVSNALTLTKGDTTTKFDGSTAQTVSIPTKTSELTNDSFVSYAEQTLTEGQQNQAKTNLGIDVLTGNTTTVTPTQVKEAILAGRPIVITYTDTTYGNLTFTSFGYSLENNVIVANLITISNGKYILADLIGMSSNDLWHLQKTELGTSTDIASNYVKYSESQNLTDDQKATARTNIGAISEADLVQPDWNQNDTSSPAYVQNRPGGYYSVVNSVNSGTLTTTDFIDFSSEGSGITGYGVQNETLNTALQNLNVTAGKTYKISWVDNGQAFSYISEAVDQVETEGSVTYHNICIFGDTIVNLTAAELIWGKTAKVILLDGNSVATATNTVTNIKIEEVNVVKIPKALVESDNIEEFDLSNNYTTTNKGSIKYNYIGTSIHAKETIQSAVLGFKDEGSMPQLELFGSMMDTNYKNTTQYLPAGIYSSWVNHSETGDTFIQGMAIRHDPNNKLLKLESKLIDNITEDLTVRGIAIPTADNDAVNKKYVDDSHVQSDWNQNDETAKDYIKNRICYAEDGTIDVYYDSADNKLSVRSIDLQLGATYNVKTSTNTSVVPSGDGTDYVCKKITDVISELSSVPEYENVLCIGGWNSETHRPDPFLVTNQPQIMSITVERYLITGSNLKINALPMKYCPTDLSLFKVVTYDSENNTFSYTNTDIEFLQPTTATSFIRGNKPVGSNYVIYIGMPAYNNNGQSPFRVESDIIPYIDTYCNFNLAGNNLPDITLGKSISYNQSNLSGIKNAEALKIFQQKYAKTNQNSVIIRGVMIFKDVTLTGYCTLDNDSTDDKPKISFFDSYKGKIYKCSFTANGDTQTLVEIQNIWDSTIISSSDVLTKTNTTAFTPTADYQPATKKYVDDNKTTITVDDALLDTSTNPVQNKVVKAAIDSKPSAADAVYTATAASTDGVAYTATVSGIDSLTVGASFIMIPNKASTSKAPTLNVNGLGAKPIRRRLSSLTTSLQQGYSTNWIALNKPFTVVYDGTAWVIEGLTKTDGADVYGAVAQATADAKGNNIADTYATIAMLQSLLPKVTTITLTSNWVGDASPYYQDIALSCVTETSIVDLQPTPEQLNSWQDDGIAFTTLSGNGTVRVYVAGGKPSSAISVQVRVQEVTVI